MATNRALSAWLIASSLLLAPWATAAPTVWTGPTISFSKPAFANPNLPENQDAVLPGTVVITRGNNQGIFNIALDPSYTSMGDPKGTLWAFPMNNPPGADIRASNYASLTFEAWVIAHSQNPPSTVDKPAVMHLVDADIYVDVMFTTWGVGQQGGGGSFSYERSTNASAVPGTSPFGLGIALMLLMAWLAPGRQGVD